MLAKTKLNAINVLISRALIDPDINHDESVSLNNVPKYYDEIKKERKIPKDAVEYNI